MQAHAHESWGEFMSVHTAGTFVCHHDPSHYSMCPAIHPPDSKGTHAAAVSVRVGVVLVACTCTACHVFACAFPHLVNALCVVQSKTKGSSLEIGTRNG